MPQKQRNYEDYVELGGLIYNANSSLVTAIVKLSKMFPLNSKHMRDLEKIAKNLSELRSRIDDDYCREFKVPQESPSFPMYPGANKK